MSSRRNSWPSSPPSTRTVGPPVSVPSCTTVRCSMTNVNGPAVTDCPCSPLIVDPQLVEATRVAAENLLDCGRAQRAHVLRRVLQRIWIQARGMREVVLEQDPVLTEALDQIREIASLEPRGRVDLALEVLEWRERHLGEVGSRVLAHLVFERFEHERHPSSTALDRHDLQRGMPFEHP